MCHQHSLVVCVTDLCTSDKLILNDGRQCKFVSIIEKEGDSIVILEDADSNLFQIPLSVEFFAQSDFDTIWSQHVQRFSKKEALSEQKDEIDRR